MSLGGFKWGGVYCKRNSLTDSEWILLIHKTRVAAFMSANSAASAGWAYYMDDSPDGIYHCLDDGTGYNYVTCFSHPNGTWYALYTLCNCTKTGTDASAAKRSLMCEHWSSYTSAPLYVGVWGCAFFRIANVPISYDDNLIDSDYPLIPIGNTASATNYTDSGNFGWYASYRAVEYSWHGFAIKSDNIIMFSYGRNNTTELSPSISVASGHAYSQLSAQKDMNSLFALNTQTCGSGWPYDETPVDRPDPPLRRNSGLSMPVCIAQAQYGGQCFNKCVLTSTYAAYYDSSMEERQYESLFLSLNGNYSKGTIRIDLLASNSADDKSSSSNDLLDTFANGNYILINRGSASSGINKNTIDAITHLYCGWDNSNPDPTDLSSYTEYTE